MTSSKQHTFDDDLDNTNGNHIINPVFFTESRDDVNKAEEEYQSLIHKSTTAEELEIIQCESLSCTTRTIGLCASKDSEVEFEKGKNPKKLIPSLCETVSCSDDDNESTTNSDFSGSEREDDYDEDALQSDGKNSDTLDKEPAKVDVAKYMKLREMTPLQERVNAVTITPGAIFCFYYAYKAMWMITPSMGYFIEQMQQQIIQPHHDHPLQHLQPQDEVGANLTTSFTLVEDFSSVKESESYIDDTMSCIDDLKHSILPPLPVIAVLLGIISHAPFSFLYHWTYAHSLPSGLNTYHWSRRMDQVMIHFMSSLISYASSACSIEYTLVNLIFNIDSIYKQLFIYEVNPKRNQTRVFISIGAYILPLLLRGLYIPFLQLLLIFSFAAWLFKQYPIGGWSHSLFHLTIALVPPIMLSVAANLPQSQEYAQRNVLEYCLSSVHANVD